MRMYVNIVISRQSAEDDTDNEGICRLWKNLQPGKKIYQSHIK
jgi:hypothetical protein